MQIELNPFPMHVHLSLATFSWFSNVGRVSGSFYFMNKAEHMFLNVLSLVLIGLASGIVGLEYGVLTGMSVGLLAVVVVFRT